MNYINIKTGEYPVSKLHIDNRKKGTKDYKIVYNSKLPEFDAETQFLAEVKPELRNGNYYRRYEVRTMNETQIQRRLDKKREEMVKVVEQYVQDVVDGYNKDNGTLFESVHNCATYVNVDGYTHQAFCKAVVEFNAKVWGMLLDQLKVM